MIRTNLTSGISPANVGRHYSEHEPNTQRSLNQDSDDGRSVNSHLVVLRDINDD